MRGIAQWIVFVLLLGVALPAYSSGLSLVQVARDDMAGVDGLHGANSVALSPDGANVYVAGRSDNAVAVFSRNAGTGVVTFVEMQRDGIGGVDGLAAANDVAVSPDGAHVYVAGDGDNAVAVFSRNAGTGALTFVEMQKDGIGGVDGLARAFAVTVSPDGAHVYVGGHDDDAVAVFSRNAGTGALTFVEIEKEGVAGVTGLRRPTAIVVSPDGAHVYVTGEGSDSVALFSRNAGTGALAFIAAMKDGVAGVDGLRRPQAIAISVDGTRVYVASAADNGVSAFTRDGGTGALTFVQLVRQDPEVQGLKGANGVAASADGTYVYATAADSDAAAVLRRDAIGNVLHFVESQFDNVPPGDGLQGASALALSVDGAFLYVSAREENALSVFKTDTCGNGNRGADEECDDANLVAGDGCSPTCRLETCAPTPAAGCRHAESGRTKLELRDRPENRSDRLKWDMKSGEATSFAEFGNPTTTADYVLCIYDMSAAPQPAFAVAAPAGGLCLGKPCWTASSVKKYTYKDKALTPDGVSGILLRVGEVDGATQIKIAGSRSNLAMPTGLPFVAPLVVQVVNGDSGLCWEATFSTVTIAPLSSGFRLKAVSD